METVTQKSTIVLYAYRYIYKDKQGRINVKILTEPQEVHAKFQQSLLDNEDVVSCVREYMHEINFEYFGYTESVKEEKKDEVTRTY